jgi:hypothetical protein
MSAAMAQVDPALVKAFIDRGVDEALAVALAQAETILACGIDDAGVPLKGVGRSIAATTIDWLRDAPLDVSRVEAQRDGGVKATKELELEADGIFEAYGVRMRVTTRSIARRRIALAILSHPVDGARPRIRQPIARYQKEVRPSTERELEGLRKGNQQRAAAAAEARKRREESRALKGLRHSPGV